MLNSDRREAPASFSELQVLSTRQRVYANGCRGPADWIDRRTADLVRALFACQSWQTTGDLDRLWSVNRQALKAEALSSDFLVVAEQVFATYGFPALEPSTRARAISERTMRNTPSLTQEGPAEASNGIPATIHPGAPSGVPEALHGASDGYGFQRPA